MGQRHYLSVPLEHGWAYLVAIMDWNSRAVLAWRLSNTLGTDFCIEALEEALRHHGPPDIFNTDPGAQFADRDWLGARTLRGAHSHGWNGPSHLVASRAVQSHAVTTQGRRKTDGAWCTGSRQRERRALAD